MPSLPEERISGIVTARKCPHCGHHEVGIVDRKGIFYPLLPGAWAEVMAMPPANRELEETVQCRNAERPAPLAAEFTPWAPAPTRFVKALRLRYGVLMQTQPEGRIVEWPVYEVSYLEKLSRLVAEEDHPSLVVILDRHFAAAHLASGGPNEIAAALFRDIEEIRQPAEAVKAWLSDQSDTTLGELLGATPPEGCDPLPPSSTEFRAELENLTLEGFLTLL